MKNKSLSPERVNSNRKQKLFFLSERKTKQKNMEVNKGSFDIKCYKKARKNGSLKFN
jgi:hypothetical protein